MEGVESEDASTAASTQGAWLSPLLRASPPIPVGRLPGRFKVILQRASLSQPWGITLDKTKRGTIIIAENAVHLGMRKGNELLGLNGVAQSTVRQYLDALDQSWTVDLDVQQNGHDLSAGDDAEEGEEPWGVCMVFPAQDNTCVDVCFAPPAPRCRAETWPMRDLLLTTGPLAEESGSIFTLKVVRASRKQPFGLNLGVDTETGISSVGWAQDPPSLAEAQALGKVKAILDTDSYVSSPRCPEWEGEGADVAQRSHNHPMDPTTDNAVQQTVIIKEDLPHFGLLRGDVLLELNGSAVTDLIACQAALRTSMSVSIELRRPTKESGLAAPGSLQLADLRRGEDRIATTSFGGFLNFLRLGFSPGQCCLNGVKKNTQEITAVRRISAVSTSEVISC